MHDHTPLQVHPEASDPSASHANIVLVDIDGRQIEVSPHQATRFAVEPLDFDQLVDTCANFRSSFQLVITNGSAPPELTGLDVWGPLRVRATIGVPEALKVFGLIKGGWAPMPWAHKRVALLDRNLILHLEKLRGPSNMDPRRFTEWLGLDSEIVSPVLFALEGGTRQTPTEEEIDAELARASDVFSRVLPGARIQQVSSVQRNAVHAMAVEHQDFRARATRLLIDAAPLVVDRKKSEVRHVLEKEVFALARHHGVRRDCLTVLALLSCIHDSRAPVAHRTATPGRAVIKPVVGYTAEAAYNALTDLFHIELLINVQTVMPDTDTVLYTADQGLAALWSAIQPCQTNAIILENGRVRNTVTFSADGGLFPDLLPEQALDLARRLGEDT